MEDVEDRLNEFLELVRRYDEAKRHRSRSRSSEKACVISNTPEALKTHLQLNVSKLGTFDALRVATEDYFRIRRIFKTTSVGNTHEDDPMEVDILSRKGKARENPTGPERQRESHWEKLRRKWCAETWRRTVLIQITFDVMSVRKPLWSTSALKRRGATIIFNHDYDRIIFQNETVNLMSHDCHSYLCLASANGIPHRKAIVMAGETLSNEVDEEVYVGDGGMGQKHTRLQLVTGEQSPMRIKRDSLTFLVRREQRRHYILLNRPQTLRG